MRMETLKVEQSLGVVDVIRSWPWVAGFKTVRCSSEECSRWLTQRHLTARKVGVSMRGKWYCGYECFARVAAQHFSQLMAKDARPRNDGSRTPLALILIQQGWMTHEQFKQAAKVRDESGEEMGATLVRLGFVTEKQLISARSVQWGCPVFRPARQPAAGVQIPVALMRLHAMVPLHYVAATNSLLIGFVYGVEYGVLYAIEEVTGCKTQACLITQSDFEEKMLAYESGEGGVSENLVFEGVQAAAKMAHLLCSRGRVANAGEIVIGRCRDYLWARVTSDRVMNDILFRAV